MRVENWMILEKSGITDLQMFENTHTSLKPLLCYIVFLFKDDPILTFFSPQYSFKIT